MNPWKSLVIVVALLTISAIAGAQDGKLHNPLGGKPKPEPLLGSANRVLDILETLDTSRFDISLFADYAVQQELWMDAMQRRSAIMAHRQAVEDAFREGKSFAEGHIMFMGFTAPGLVAGAMQGIYETAEAITNTHLEPNLRQAFEIFYEGELDDKQKIRFHQVMFQLLGPNMAFMKAVSATEDQVKMLLDEYKKIPEAVKKVRNNDPMKQNALQTAALADARLAAIKAVLKEDQFKAWRALVGPQLKYGGPFNRAGG